MQAPGYPEEDRSDGFEHGGWHLPHVADVAARVVGETMARTDAFLFGPTTCEILAAYGPCAPAGGMFAGR